MTRPTADERYRDPAWETFRALVDAWVTLGGTMTLARYCGVTDDTIDRWRLGISTPSIAVRDAASEWMIRRAQARARARATARGTG